MKVFVIAFACEPNRTSEPGVGWNIVGELAKRHELTVLTRCNNRESIEAYLSENSDDARVNIHWVYLDLSEWLHRLKKKIPCGIQLYQELWQLKAARMYRGEFAKYDIVHHLTFGSIFFTPWGARYTDRFVWGPIGGASGAMESAFLKREDWRSRITEAFYRLVAWYSYHPAPWASKCRNACSAILFRTSELAQHIRLSDHQKVAVVGETAYAAPILPRSYNQTKHPLRVMSVGRLIPLKGVRYAISAFAEFLSNGGSGVFDIYGDGPLRCSLQEYAAKNGVSEYVVFHGNVPNQEVLKALDRADVLIHASFREGGSWTILEAMAHGVPVICQDRAGMKDMITSECGKKIAAKSPNDLSVKMADALKDFFAKPELITKFGLAGQSRASSIYSWSRVSDVIEKTYQGIV